MSAHIKRAVAVAFVVASVPVLLLQRKFTEKLTSEPDTLPSQEADKIAKELHALRQRMSDLTVASASSSGSRRLGLDKVAHKQGASPNEDGANTSLGTENAQPRSLSGSETFLQRRAVYTRWGSSSCPMGSMKLYSGFISTSYYTHSGSGYNMLCMHPSPQLPAGYDAADNNGALLYGVEYENTGAIDKHHDYDAACAVCQWQMGATVYVEWGNGDSRHNPTTPKVCSNPAHDMIYTGLIMSEHYTHKKGENICVDLERAYYGEDEDSDDNHNGGLLYTVEMEQGSADEYAYPHNRELGCTVCGIPAKSVDIGGEVTVTPESETTVFTVWGKRDCPNGQLVYTGFMAGAHYNHGGSGANYICMTTSGAEAPSGYSDGNQDGGLLYGTEYQNTGAIDANHDGDAACAVCRYNSHHKDVYVQWGRSSYCSNSHHDVYSGHSMGNHYTQHRSTRVCVHTSRETHAQSSWSDNNGALLYTTEIEWVSGHANYEVGCTSCGGTVGKSVFTRWGSRTCPDGSSALYQGNMMAEHYTHRGGGANTICMHPQIQTPSGASSHNQDGDLLYQMEYENTGAIDAHHDHEAACTVCELNHWESVYTQWGRSTTCTNDHITLYTGFVMAEHYKHNKGEFICVDSGRAVTTSSNGGDQNGGLLYSTEMEQGSSDEALYPHNVEVGCAVCVAQFQAQEVPFVRQISYGPNGESYLRNAIHGEWVKIASLTTGQDVTVSYGYTSASGTSSSEDGTRTSAQSRAVDISTCASASFTASLSVAVQTEARAGPFGVGHELEVGFSSTVGMSTCGGETNSESSSVARAVAQGTSWSQSITETRSFSLSIPGQLPAGVPEADTISTLGVDVWQWQWTIVEGAHDGVGKNVFEAKAQSRFVLSPVSTGATERRPCCYPGQEYGVLWYPFNCKTSAGLLPGADNAAHCGVGPPGEHAADQWSEQQVLQWLGTLGLSASYTTEQWYTNTVSSKKLDGKAIGSLLRIIDESPYSYNAVMNVFGFTPDGATGDALKIMRGLVLLRSER